MSVWFHYLLTVTKSRRSINWGKGLRLLV